MHKKLQWLLVAAVVGSMSPVFAQGNGGQGDAPGGPGGGPGGGLGSGGGGGQCQGRRGGGGARAGQFRQKMMTKFDANHDGQLDDSEKAQIRAFREQRRQEREAGGGGLGNGGPGAGGGLGAGGGGGRRHHRADGEMPAPPSGAPVAPAGGQ